MIGADANTRELGTPALARDFPRREAKTRARKTTETRWRRAPRRNEPAWFQYKMGRARETSPRARCFRCFNWPDEGRQVMG